MRGSRVMSCMWQSSEGTEIEDCDNKRYELLLTALKLYPLIM